MCSFVGVFLFTLCCLLSAVGLTGSSEQVLKLTSIKEKKTPHLRVQAFWIFETGAFFVCRFLYHVSQYLIFPSVRLCSVSFPKAFMENSKNLYSLNFFQNIYIDSQWNCINDQVVMFSFKLCGRVLKVCHCTDKTEVVTRTIVLGQRVNHNKYTIYTVTFPAAASHIIRIICSFLGMG